MYSFVKSEWLKLGGGGGIEGLLVDKCGFARKHFMLGKYRGLQSVLDSWPDPQNCSHFLLPPGLTGFLSTPLFGQIPASKLTFFSQYLFIKFSWTPFSEPFIIPMMIIIVSFLLPLDELDCTMYCLFAGFHNGFDGWIQKGLGWTRQKGQTWLASADNIVKFLSGQFGSCTNSDPSLRIAAKRKVFKPRALTVCLHLIQIQCYAQSCFYCGEKVLLVWLSDALLLSCMAMYVWLGMATFHTLDDDNYELVLLLLLLLLLLW